MTSCGSERGSSNATHKTPANSSLAVAVGSGKRYAPGYIPKRAPKPPGSDWVHEIKHDRYRLQVCRAGDTVRLFTRRGSRSVRRDLLHQPDNGAAQFCIFDAGERPY